MIFGRASFENTQIKTFRLTGGLNEQISGIELRPGELIECTNYIEQDDAYHGYEALKGYEVYDGRTAPSSIQLNSYSLIEAGIWDDAKTWINTDNWSDTVPVAAPGIDDAREAQRDLISAVPGTGSVLGVHIYDDKLYAFRDSFTGPTTRMYVADSVVGWGDGSTTATPIVGTTMGSGGFIRAVNGRFAEYQSNAEVMIWVDGMSQPQVWNGTTASSIDIGATLGSPFDTTYPTHVGIWQNRMFLAYPDGHILFSEVGDPTAWDATTGFAGEIYIGKEAITGIKEVSSGALLFFTKNFIKVLNYGSTSNEFIFRLDDFPKGIGSRSDTILSLQDTLYFADDRGLSSIGTSVESGGITTNLIGKKVNKTYTENLSNFSVATVDRETNRYYLFYDDSITNKTSGLVFTFFNKRLKGATKIVLEHRVESITEGTFSDGANKIFFGSNDGKVYQFLSGTSFNGEAISTSFETSYHHYGSPRSWKRFRRLEFEIDAQNGTEFTISSSFDYASRDLARTIDHTSTVDRGGGTWGTSVWGSFIWGNDILNRTPIYTNGYGTNMAVKVETESKYKESHIIHNITTDYSTKGIQR